MVSHTGQMTGAVSSRVLRWYLVPCWYVLVPVFITVSTRATSRKNILTLFSILSEFKATEYSDSIRFDSIRFDSIRFDSIRFDSIRFVSIYDSYSKFRGYSIRLKKFQIRPILTG